MLTNYEQTAGARNCVQTCIWIVTSLETLRCLPWGKCIIQNVKCVVTNSS